LEDGVGLARLIDDPIEKVGNLSVVFAECRQACDETEE
jgi:hypothetical protein